MTLSNNIPIRILGDKFEEKYSCYTTSAQTFYTGIPIVIDQSTSSTLVVTADGLACVDGDVFVGLAAEKKVIAAGDPVTYITVLGYPAIVGIPCSTFTIADLGKVIYASATGSTSITLSASNGAYPALGKLFTVKDGYAFIQISAPTVLDVP